MTTLLARLKCGLHEMLRTRAIESLQFEVTEIEIFEQLCFGRPVNDELPPRRGRPVPVAQPKA